MFKFSSLFKKLEDAHQKKFSLEDDIFTLDILKGVITAGFVGYFITGDILTDNNIFVVLSFLLSLWGHRIIKERRKSVASHLSCEENNSLSKE